VLGISDLATYLMASGSKPAQKEEALLEKQFDSRFVQQLKELISQIIQEERSVGPSPPQTPPATRNHNNEHNFPCMKMDFPRWEEDDPSGWVSSVKRFFRFYGTPKTYRVEIASIHLEGEVVQWYDWFEARRGTPTWAAFVEGLLVRFCPSAFEDVDVELAKI
jgi:hypothetical protein